MEEVTDMLRDQATLHQDMLTSKNHMEMTAISDGFKTTKRSFPMDCYYTMVAKWEVEQGKITKISWLPAYLPADGAPYLVKRDDPLFGEILDYMNKITAHEGLMTEYWICGDEIVLTEAAYE